MKIGFLVKISVLAIILIGAVVAVFKVDDTVESFLPVVSTVKLSEAEYHTSVQGKGSIYRGDEDAGGWYAVVAVGENDISKVENGQSALVTGIAFPEETLRAQVVDIADKARLNVTAAGTETVVDVYLRFTDEAEFLRDGYTASAQIRTSETKTVGILPYEVIAQDIAGEYVYVIEGNRIVRHDIVTGEELSEGVEIVSGVASYDEVICEPHKFSNNSLAKKQQTTERR